MMPSIKPYPDFICKSMNLQPVHYGQSSVEAAIRLASQTGSHVRLSSVSGVDTLAILGSLVPMTATNSLHRNYSCEHGLIEEIQSPPRVDELTLIDCPLATFEQLFGQLGFYQEQWHFRPGILLTANKSFVVLRADQLIDSPELTSAIAATVRSKCIQLPQQNVLKAAPLQLAKTPLKCQIIVIGHPVDLMALEDIWLDIDVDLPIYGEFYDRIAIDNTANFSGWLATLAHSACSARLSLDACEFLMRLASRWAQHNQFFSVAAQHFSQLITEAYVIANQAEVTAHHLKTAHQQRKERQNQLANDSYRDFAEGTIKLQVSDAVVGQVNGLTVVEIGSISYGEPARITATVHYGDGDVIDIERKAELAGNIHAKGTLILAAYLAQIFAKDAPLHLSANIVFEQSYYEVDGDSASLAELIALLSALARLPIYQHMAVTGAIDQFGYVQAIGGVNEKIEGFYQVASRLAPEQPVAIIMPASNALQLNLNDDCAEAISKGLLTIHTITHVSEALELLTGTPSGIGQEDAEQNYPEHSVFGRVQRRLLDLADPIEDESSLMSRIFGLFANRNSDRA